MKKKVAFLFPGQGAQYPGMGKSFFDAFGVAKQTFEEANDVLGRDLAQIVFNGPEDVLTETRNSQVGIYVASMATLRVVHSLFPSLVPSVCAGLSLGEYTALTASGRLSFADGLPLVQKRGELMNEACEMTKGGMAAVLGLDAEAMEEAVKEVRLPHDLWIANFNCPGQIVISGTEKGIEAGMVAAKAKGAKRVLPLPVHGAFHSGLMRFAEERLKPYIEAVPLAESALALVMNVTGSVALQSQEIRENLIAQVTHSVRWEQGIRKMDEMQVDLFVAFGCCQSLAGFNKRIGTNAPFVCVETEKDLAILEEQIT